MTKIYWSPDYCKARHAFDTTRKSAFLAHDLMTTPIDGVEITSPDPVTGEDLAMIHHPRYVNAVQWGVKPLCSAQGFKWDKGMWDATTASTGGVVASCLEAMETGVSGSLSSGLHHAHYLSGSGFCTFNGLALGALKALANGAKSVLIIDTDAHCGGGTDDIVWDDDRIVHLDLSVCDFDSYPTGSQGWAHLIDFEWDPAWGEDPSAARSEGASTLDVVRDVEKYLPTLEARLDALRGHNFDLIIYNSGMDPHEDCKVGGLKGITDLVIAEREEMVFDFAKSEDCPIAFVLAGGYTGKTMSQDHLTALHRMTVAEAAKATPALTWWRR